MRRETERPAPTGKMLIVANGTLPAAPVLQSLVRWADLLVCADGGANNVRKHRIRPDAIIGDFDSITPTSQEYFRDVVQIRLRDQESTDLEKAISFGLHSGYTRIAVAGATGDRMDHATGALGCFKRFGQQADLAVIDTVGVLRPVRERVALQVTAGEKLSLIPLGRCTGVTTRNLRYALSNETLEPGVREGISNEARGRRVVITVRRGILLFYRFYSRGRFSTLLLPD